jgi:cobalt-zinc-cadmium efflux system outer membrane protein
VPSYKITFFVLSAVIGANCADAETFSDCSQKLTIQEFVNCARVEAPEYQMALGTAEAASLQSKASRRWLNPDFDSQSMYGLNQGNQQYQFQFTLLQTIEFGGRRSARINEAQAELEKSEASLQNMDAEARSKIYSKILRLGQIDREKASLEEAIQTFQKLISQYASRPRLSPEQEVSNAVFRLAHGDFLMRKVQLSNDEREVTNELKLHLRTDDDSFRKWITDPTVTLAAYESKDFVVEKTPEYKLSLAEFLNAKAQKNNENAEFFSEIKVGPMAQIQSDGAQRAQLYGAQVSFPFPVWNQNGYGRESGDRKIEVAQIGLELEKKRTLLERGRLLLTYQDYLNSLKLVPTQKDLEAKHNKVEAQYMRGLVNSALIIEAHRSLIDFQKLRHESEIKALEILWNLYRLDGRVEEIRL